MIYGYARVSTTDQDLSVQLDALKKYGYENIRQEKVSGISLQGRDELKVILDFMCNGDELEVTRGDRLVRSLFNFHDILKTPGGEGLTHSTTEHQQSCKFHPGI